jgi:hypothetical protein
VPVLTSLLAARRASSARRPSSPSAIRHRAASRITAVLAGTRGPFARRPGARSGLRLLRARLRREVLGFGAVLITRSWRHGPGRRPSRGSPLGARAGRRWRGSRRPRSLLAAKRWIACTSSVVCSIVNGPSPHSLPNRSPCGSMLRGRGSESVSIRSLFSSSSVPGRAGSRYGTRIPVGRTGAGRPELDGEPGRNPSGTCVDDQEGGGKAVPRFDRCGGPLLVVRFRIESITTHTKATSTRPTTCRSGPRMRSRAFREVRRRTRPMGPYANTASADRIMFGVTDEMNERWRGAPQVANSAS